MNVGEPDLNPAAGDATSFNEPSSTIVPDLAELYLPPRLGIIHLLSWITVTAVFLKVSSAMRLFETAPNPAARTANVGFGYQAPAFIQLAMTAAGVVGLSVLVRGWLRHKRGQLAPGHWVLIAFFIPDLAMIALLLVYYIITRLHEGFLNNSQLLILAQMAVFLLRAAIFVGGARRVREKLGWTITFHLLAIINAGLGILTGISVLVLFKGRSISSPGIVHVTMLLPVIVGIITSLILGFVAAIDLLRSRRDWLHWLGIVIYIVVNMIPLFYEIVKHFAVPAG